MVFRFYEDFFPFVCAERFTVRYFWVLPEPSVSWLSGRIANQGPKASNSLHYSRGRFKGKMAYKKGKLNLSLSVAFFSLSLFLFSLSSFRENVICSEGKLRAFQAKKPNSPAPQLNVE